VLSTTNSIGGGLDINAQSRLTFNSMAISTSRRSVGITGLPTWGRRGQVQDRARKSPALARMSPSDSAVRTGAVTLASVRVAAMARVPRASGPLGRHRLSMQPW